MAANSKVTKGLVAIMVGVMASDGGPATSFPTQLGFTERGSVSLTEDDATVVEIFAEEVDDAIDIDTTRGPLNLSLRLNNPDVDSLLLTFGGTITGTAPNRVWNAPDTMPSIEMSVRITPKQGMITTLPRVKLMAKLDYKIGRDGTMGVIVTGRVLTPAKAGVPSRLIGNPVIV